MVPRFNDLSPPEPDEAAWARKIDQWVRDIGGPDEAAAVEAVRSWDRQGRVLATWSAWTQIRYAQDTRDPQALARNARLDELGPRLQALDLRLKSAVLDSPHREALRAAWGAQALALWQLDRESQDEALVEDQIRESALVSEQGRLSASARIPFRGEERSLAQLSAWLEDPDRGTRYEASRAFWSWYAEQGPAFAAIFDQLVGLRHGMARRLGEADFVALGYRQMRRRGYGPAEVARFRDEVERHLLPLVLRLRERQARRLGLPALMVWDLRVSDPRGNPRPDPDPRVQTEQARTLFQRLGLRGFFDRLDGGGLLDLAARPGKRPGGFCHFLAEPGLPFVFANMNGTTADTRVFTHELGHALQAWLSRDAPLQDLVWPTYEAAEVASMSLELLSWPHMDLFYGAEADRYRRDHLASALVALPWMCALDEFQHRVYADPAADRDALWRELEARWQPDLRWGDLPHGPQGRRWQAVAHLYATPFYMIDYALAQVCALQLWSLARRDPDEAMRRYLAICSQGGRAPFLELLGSAGLVSPFEPGLLPALLAEAEEALQELE